MKYRCPAPPLTEIHTGVMVVSRLFIDSEPVFISGDGRVLLDPETLDSCVVSPKAADSAPQGTGIARYFAAAEV